MKKILLIFVFCIYNLYASEEKIHIKAIKQMLDDVSNYYVVNGKFDEFSKMTKIKTEYAGKDEYGDDRYKIFYKGVNCAQFSFSKVDGEFSGEVVNKHFDVCKEFDEDLDDIDEYYEAFKGEGYCLRYASRTRYKQPLNQILQIIINDFEKYKKSSRVVSNLDEITNIRIDKRPVLKPNPDVDTRSLWGFAECILIDFYPKQKRLDVIFNDRKPTSCKEFAIDEWYERIFEKYKPKE
ncbi:hypothetical protein [Campylobacter concisus]|jgi:hypothetical protein|uniref:hypothetical protein n=1 Tax=Campylobacter concisus TaxID=199 RepID=UPI00122D0190|nr:hypothetical protein [Campylobacter concisus]